MGRFRDERYEAIDRWNETFLNLDRKLNEKESEIIYRYSFKVKKERDYIKAIFGDYIHLINDQNFIVKSEIFQCF